MQYKKLVVEHNNPKKEWKRGMTNKQINGYTHPKVSTGKNYENKEKVDN
jgi:V8-like Glu-specific endopeptidase